MTTKIAGVVLVALGALMIGMGLQLVSLPPLNPPIVSGVGFLVAAFALLNHKH